MPIQRHIFDVEYADDPNALPREFRTRVILRDKIDVEQNGHKHGLMDSRQQPQLCGLLWLWYSARREGHVPAETTFDEFAARCLDNALVKDEPVPPTEAAGGSPSPSAATSPASATTDGLPPYAAMSG